MRVSAAGKLTMKTTTFSPQMFSTSWQQHANGKMWVARPSRGLLEHVHIKDAKIAKMIELEALKKAEDIYEKLKIKKAKLDQKAHMKKSENQYL